MQPHLVPRPARWVLAAGAAYGLLYAAVYLRQWDGEPLHLFSDWFAFWSAGRLVASGGAAQVYDADALQAFQQAIPGHPDGAYPVPYPPPFLPLLAAVSVLPYLPSFALWITATFAASAAAMPRPRLAWLLAPAALLNVVFGQNGFLSAALAVGGLRLASTRPVVAGVLLGALTYKPQLFVLVPVALASAGLWRALAATVASAAVLAAASAAWFGPGLWADWLAMLPSFSTQVESELAGRASILVSLAPWLRLAGAPRAVALGAQLAAACAAAGITWVACRRGLTPVAIATVLAATLACTPYAYVYDLTLVSAGVLLVARPARLAEVSIGDATALLFAWALPLLAVSAGRAGIPIGPAGVAAWLVWLAVRER